MADEIESNSPLPLASSAEREEVLRDLHPIFRHVDAAFHIYLEILVANAAWDNDQIEHELRRRGVDELLSQDIVAFAPLAFVRVIVDELGVKAPDTYVLQNATDGSQREMAFAHEIAFGWAKAMIRFYRTRERNEIFKRVSSRSAEVNAINNALWAGATREVLRESVLHPPYVCMRRPARQ